MKKFWLNQYDISQMIFDTEILRFEIAYFSNLAHAWSGKLGKYKVDLHYGDYRSKLGLFEEQENIFFTFCKGSSLERFTP